MSCYKDLQIENQELREQLITLSRSIRRVQDQATDEEISVELELLLCSIPITSIPIRRYHG